MVYRKGTASSRLVTCSASLISGDLLVKWSALSCGQVEVVGLNHLVAVERVQRLSNLIRPAPSFWCSMEAPFWTSRLKWQTKPPIWPLSEVIWRLLPANTFPVYARVVWPFVLFHAQRCAQMQSPFSTVCLVLLLLWLILPLHQHRRWIIRTQ